MKYLAVIFDSFGTLADNFSSREYYDALGQMALSLSVPSDDFTRAWFDTSRERNTGAFQGCEANVEHICRQLGVQPEVSQIAIAAQIRLDYMRHVMTPRSDATEVLSCLKGDGYKTGLISDCTPEVPLLWPETPLAPLIDEAVFSCSVGLRKPDSRIYQFTTQRLNVPPEQCLYVGDGGSQELSGALEVGMHPVLIRLDADSTEPHLINREQWDGRIISSLKEVLNVVTED